MRPIAFLYPFGRIYYPLDGNDWRIRISNDGRGLKRKWYNPKRWGSDSVKMEIKVPSCWQSGHKLLRDYKGAVWYFKKFTLTPDTLKFAGKDGKSINENTSVFGYFREVFRIKNPVSDMRYIPLTRIFGKIILEMIASDFETDVWINGKYMGKNRGGYSRRTYDVTNALGWGENYIIIRVYDPPTNRHIPVGKQGGDWYGEISGIWGSIYLEFIPGPFFFTDIKFTTIADVSEKDNNSDGVGPGYRTFTPRVWKSLFEIMYDFTEADEYSPLPSGYRLELSLLSLGTEGRFIEYSEQSAEIFADKYGSPVVKITVDLLPNYSSRKLRIRSSIGGQFYKLRKKRPLTVGNAEIFGSEDIKADELGVVVKHRKISVSFRIENPELWEDHNPSLYGVVVRVHPTGFIDDKRGNNENIGESPGRIEYSALKRNSDTVSLEIGFRDVRIRDSMIYINGHPKILRGVLDQAYHPDTLYNYPDRNGLPDEFIRGEIILLKKAGINLNRKHIKIEDPRYIFWCDHLGMYYWEEMPNFYIPHPHGISVFADELKRMVIRDKNHPSIIIWGIANEEWGFFGIWTGIWNRLLRKFFSWVRRYDRTRLIVDNSGWAHAAGQTDINDYHDYYIIPDSYLFWRQKIDGNLRNPHRNFRTGINREKAALLPVMISEFGCCGLPHVDNLGIPTDLPPEIMQWHKSSAPPEIPDWIFRGPSDPARGDIYAAGIYARFNTSVLPKFFGDRRILETEDQMRQYLNLKYLIEEMRIRKVNNRVVSGYIITELSDIEWEYNGLLDYKRYTKDFYPLLPTVNADTVIVIRPVKRNIVLTPDTEIGVNLYISDFGGKKENDCILVCKIIESDISVLTSDFTSTDTYLNWSGPEHPFAHKKEEDYRKYLFDPKTGRMLLGRGRVLMKFEFKTDLPGYGAYKAATLIVKSSDLITKNREFVEKLHNKGYVRLRVECLLTDRQGNIINGNFEEILILSEKHPAFAKDPAEIAEENGVLLSEMLKSDDLKAVENGKKAVVFFSKFAMKKIASVNKKLWNYKSMIRAGLYSVIYGRMIKKLRLFVKLHPFGENWIAMFSMPFVSERLLRPIENIKRPGWELVNIMPNYKFELDVAGHPFLIQRTAPTPDYEIIAGIVEGWLNKIYPTILKIRYGKGEVLLCLLPLIKELRKKDRANPIARLIMYNLIKMLAD